MRKMLVVVLLWASAAACAEGPDALDLSRLLDSAGALQLALNHVEQSQPRDAAAPSWAEWEMLRLNLLNRLGRQSDLLQRVSTMSATMPAAPLRDILVLAVRAATATGQGSLARKYAARVLWQLGAGSGEAKELRLLIIDSLVADKQGEDAFRSMLRYQQDYQPLDRDTATRFVADLLELGMAKEAVNWLGGVDDASPLKLQLRLGAGLVSADAAIKQARAQLAKSNNLGYWQVLEQAAVMQKNRALQIESVETLLQLAAGRPPQQQAEQVRQLWQIYLATALEAGNQNQLLVGDDVTWADFAARRLATQPFLSRALYAQLAQRGQSRDTRHHAQLQMVLSLQSGKRDQTALRLFQHADIDVGVIDNRARYLLGAIAESRNMPVAALHFWQRLNTPSNVGADEWQLRIAAVALRAGKADRAAAALKNITDAKKPLSAEFAQRTTILAQEILDADKTDLAIEIFDALLPLIGAQQQRSVLFALGRAYEITNQPPVAADYYLRSALLAGSRPPDTLALQARLAAALNLARAGYKDDARAQFEWLLKNSKDAAQLELARRELKKL